jgi:glycolate oxidase FAD binding subunit
MLEPASYEEAAELLKASGEVARAVRPVGGATKLGWGGSARTDVDVSTASLSAIREHNAGDLTAVLEAGARLAHVQEVFAEAGQMLALDPPLGAGDAATIGGIVATGDSGPLRHRYGAPRDLVIGITVALSDGTIAKSGGKGIKNVAGYDLGKLFAGSFGTLGLILGVAVRLHPRPATRSTAFFRSGAPDALATTAAELAHAPLELEALDVRWEHGRGAVLARAAGTAALDRARSMVERWGGEVVEADDALWAAQGAGQRSEDGIVLRVSALPARLGRLLEVAERAGARLVGRAGLGVAWVTLPDVSALDEVRREFGGVVLDRPPGVELDAWEPEPPAAGLMRRVKDRFDPAGILNPGVFAGGI